MWLPWLNFLTTLTFKVIEKFIRKAHRQRNDGKNMTYEASTFMYAMAVSIFAIGGMCGGFIGGWIANKFGRKGGLLVNNLVGIIAALAMAFSKHVTSYELLILGRFLIGVNCGKWILMGFPVSIICQLYLWNKNKITLLSSW